MNAFVYDPHEIMCLVTNIVLSVSTRRFCKYIACLSTWRILENDLFCKYMSLVSTFEHLDLIGKNVQL